MAIVTNIMGFGKPLPAPFESFKSAIGSSRYSATGYSRVSGRSTLSADLIKAMYLFGGIPLQEKAEFGIGITKDEQRYVLEFQRESGQQHKIVVYQGSTGKLDILLYDAMRQTGEGIPEDGESLDAVPILLCLFPSFLKDLEFRKQFEEFVTMGQNGFPSITEARTVAGILCDNVYRRMLINSLDTFIPLKDHMGRVSFSEFESGELMPEKILGGNFSILSNGSLTVREKTDTDDLSVLTKESFVGQYEIRPRDFTKEEELLIPHLEDWYLIKKEDVDLCDSIRCSSNMNHPFRNFVLLGTAGSGKSKTCEAVAAGLHLPLVRYTCSSNTEIFDFIGQVMPDTEQTTGDTPRFIYTRTEFIEGVKKGWVVEIQEPDIIANEGVLVGLNGLLEEGQMTLPTGEVIVRHPDNVIIFTANTGYNGCREMNQSVLDRADEMVYIETPKPEIMARRAMAISNHPSYETVHEMAEIITDIAASMREMGITQGVCGMRSLIAWAIKSLMINPYDAAITTVINKLSLEEEEREVLLERLNNSSFYK